MVRPVLQRLEATIHSDRQAAISASIDAIGKVGGWITNHTLFSDSLAVINFVIPQDSGKAIIPALAEMNIAATSEAEIPAGSAAEEIHVQLSLTFANNSGDLRHEVPAVG